MRRLFPAFPVFVLVLCAACGHDAEIDARFPAVPPTPPPPRVVGEVLVPQGIFARLESPWGFLLGSIVPDAFALAPSVLPVRTPERVGLYLADDGDAADGEIDEPLFLASDVTEAGRFSVPLLGGVGVGDCGLLLQVGAGSTRIRAFVFALEQDLSAVSETVVRLVLAYRSASPGASLCAFSPEEIGELTRLVDDLSRTTDGLDIADLNARVEARANASPGLLRAVERFGAS
ncbi:MAG: hypothetical protein KatS3mg076_1638 [Candidatus Binatia bacterium]|nr:MAG: hypothetical protein KatS3mg076_1638 [Candidatus Binatia bacterium]